MVAGNTATCVGKAGGYSLLASLCIHVAVFAFLGIIVLDDVPEPRESVSVQLVKATQQVRKLHRSIPKLRSQTADHVDLPRRSQDIARPLVNHANIPSQVATEASFMFQYEPVELREPSIYSRIIPPRRPLKAPKMRTSKPTVHHLRESMGVSGEASVQGSEDWYPLTRLLASSDRVASDSAILHDFLQIVSRRIEKSKRYPRWAIDAGLEGKVVVRFTILQDGTLGKEPQLVRSSGTKVLDNAAIAAIKESAPFPALPQALNREWLQIELPMDFRLRAS